MVDMMDMNDEEIKLAKDLAKMFKEVGPEIVKAAIGHWPADSNEPHILFLREAAAAYIK